MAGHYTVRRALRDMLITHLPAQLQARRAQLGLDFVPDVDSASGYYLTDAIPMDDVNPRVLISSSEADLVRSDGYSGTAARSYDYACTIAITVHTTVLISDEQASASRDVLLLAVRDCLLLHRALDGGAEIVRPDLSHEEVGPADVPDKLKRRVSVGQIDVTVRQTDQAVLASPVIATASTTTEPLP